MPETNNQKLPGRVYFVESAADDTVRIALDVTNDGTYVRWFDTIKERIMKIEKIVDENLEHFVFERAKDEGNGTYTFVPMTLEIFRAKVKQHILIPQDFKNEETMLKGFEETRNQAW